MENKDRHERKYDAKKNVYGEQWNFRSNIFKMKNEFRRLRRGGGRKIPALLSVNSTWILAHKRSSSCPSKRPV